MSKIHFFIHCRLSLAFQDQWYYVLLIYVRVLFGIFDANVSPIITVIVKSICNDTFVICFYTIYYKTPGECATFKFGFSYHFLNNNPSFSRIFRNLICIVFLFLFLFLFYTSLVLRFQKDFYNFCMFFRLS